MKTRLGLAVAAGVTSLVLFFSILTSQAESAETPSVQSDVAGLIASGELGAAADLAAKQTDGARSELIEQVVDAQFQSGNPEAAKAMTSHLENPRGRVEAGARVARGQVNHGGASFQELIMLIQMVTGGEDSWDQEGTGAGGVVLPSFSGIKVDPQGVLVRQTREDRTGRLDELDRRARQAMLNYDMETPSALRLVSLTRLEREVARRISEGKPVVESMRNLAGLSEVQFLLIDREQNEIVIGGPAEGWRYNKDGLPIGTNSQLPTLQLDDLVTVLRTFDGSGERYFGCSIDPRQENLKAVQEFVATSQSRGPLSPAGVRSWSNKIGQILGAQDISVVGIPEDSRVARVLVEADYRMKLIGLGKLKNNARIPSYFDLLAKDSSLASGRLDALRWWMTLGCEAIVRSPEGNAFEIRGSGVKCLSENQFLTASGERVSTGKSETINQQFAENFTAKYDELAKHDPVFAELRGIFDLALVAAIIQNHQLDQKVNWDRGSFAQGGNYHPVRYQAPKQTNSIVNHRVYNGTDIVLQVAGGVRGDVQAILNDANLQQESPRLNAVATKSKAPELPSNRWWWDAQQQ
ncbi:MAG TPA: DUF1598 domain-containing protein [Planctomicrobium sp.]|nr:DUF1598 domain-containing protein [Planctomicrobium sp.]